MRVLSLTSKKSSQILKNPTIEHGLLKSFVSATLPVIDLIRRMVHIVLELIKFNVRKPPKMRDA